MWFCSQKYQRIDYWQWLYISDIAVIYRQDNSYDGIIDSVFDKYNIPYFMDKEEDIFTKPLIKLVSSILETINNSYQRKMY